MDKVDIYQQYNELCVNNLIGGALVLILKDQHQFFFNYHVIYREHLINETILFLFCHFSLFLLFEYILNELDCMQQK